MRTVSGCRGGGGGEYPGGQRAEIATHGIKPRNLFIIFLAVGHVIRDRAGIRIRCCLLCTVRSGLHLLEHQIWTKAAWRAQRLFCLQSELRGDRGYPRRVTVRERNKIRYRRSTMKLG